LLSRVFRKLKRLAKRVDEARTIRGYRFGLRLRPASFRDWEELEKKRRLGG
jgi:hypothetical protein